MCEVIGKVVGNNQALIMGDFNFSGIIWETMDCDAPGETLRDLCMDNFLFQHVRKPTRGNSILDLVISTEEGMVEDVQVVEELGNSDHKTVKWVLCTKTESVNETRVRYNFTRGKYTEMAKTSGKKNWKELFEGKDVEGMWHEFRNIMDTVIDKYVPKVRSQRRWKLLLDKTAEKARQHKRTMHDRWKQTGSYNDHVEYKRARNKAQREIRRAIYEHEVKLARNAKKQPKKFYAYIRGKTRTKDIVGPLKDKNGKVIESAIKNCEVLNNFFASVFTEEVTKDGEKFRDLGYNVEKQLLDVEITEEHVLCKIKGLKDGKAPGEDGISSTLLRKIAESISEPLAKIFRLSLDTGDIPMDWKRANISAIYKKGPKTDPGNYRPVSLTSQICKLFEAIIRDNIVFHLNDGKLIKDSQHGFRNKRSCLTNLLSFFEEVSEYSDQRVPVDVIYLDFAKAFDKVPHVRLMHKVRQIGINGKVAVWIENWLAHRQQRVVMNDVKSEWKEVKSGVPQGSVLGPGLFIIYVNDMDDKLKNRIIKFADDTKIVGKAATDENRMSIGSDLEQLKEWSKEWLMEFNVDKCKVMHVGENNVKASYRIGNKELSVIEKEKDLGVVVQDNLKAEGQVEQAVLKANRVLGMVNRSFVNKDREVIVRIYKALIRPHLEYGVQAWRPYLEKDKLKLEKVQRRMTRMIPGLRELEYEERLKLIGLQTLETRRIRGDLIETYKIFTGKEDIIPEEFFKLNLGNTRGHRFKVFKKQSRLDVRKFSFSRRIVNLWNGLPDEVVGHDSINGFKARLDIWMGSRGFT